MFTDLSRFRAIGFDADDTLWHNERFYQLSLDRFTEMLEKYTNTEKLHETLVTTEIRNLGHYGFGVKGFTLSMIETAIEVTNANVHASVIKELIEIGQDMLNHPLDLLEGAHHCVATLSQIAPLYMITKGDLLHQERKLAQSKLGNYFTGIEIVSDKTPSVYESILEKIGCPPDEFLMIGNSVKSDILPVLKIGAWACYVPFENTWQYESAATPNDHPKFAQIRSLGDLVK